MIYSIYFLIQQIASKLGLGDYAIILSSMQLRNSYEGKIIDILKYKFIEKLTYRYIAWLDK